MRASKTTPSNAKAIYKVLTKAYPNVKCELDFQTPFQLLVATVLSAQCTDKRVNQVTPKLFGKFPTAKKMAGAKVEVIEELIHSTGFFRGKARNIKNLAIMIMDQYGSDVPADLDKLVKLPGVGRKTANVVLGHAFDIPGITVDTHFGRLSRRFGWTTSLDPVKVEHEVGALIPKKEWTNLSQRMIWHGRRICHSRKPACAACPLASLCPSYGMGEMDKVKALAMVKSDEDFR
ncbi:MAG: endonuclease III [Actinobacteria bacterium]|nr:endonuclease III [Actinomycetota bacterium]